MTDNDDAAFAAVAAELPAQNTDTLQRARQLVAQVRDIDQRLTNIDEQRAELVRQADDIRRVKLVELFTEVGIKHLSIEPQGNAPGYEAKLRPFYKASIPADWPPERREAAFKWLDSNGDGDLIRHTFVVALPRDAAEDAEAVRNALDVLGIEFEEQMAVHHATLTAWLKEQTEKKRTGIPLDTLGATVGQLVELKPLKK